MPQILSSKENFMHAGKRWASLLGLALTCLTGCAHDFYMDQALLADSGRIARNNGVPESYLVGCPDVLEIHIDGRANVGGRCEIGPDGCVDLGQAGKVRVEGKTVGIAAQQIADAVDIPESLVHVRVADYRSQQVYLFGEVEGLQRAVPYQGPETVLDLLQRTGGITPGAAVGEVHVVRPNIAEGKLPEVYHIDLEAIVQKQDQRTNMRLQPFDQVHVGETRKSCLAKCMSPCFRPLFKKMCGLSR